MVDAALKLKGVAAGGCEDNGSSCSDDTDCCSGNCVDFNCENLDPIIIDLSGHGYQLTSAAEGTKVDFFRNRGSYTDVMDYIRLGWRFSSH
jgi:hypothetical protein